MQYGTALGTKSRQVTILGRSMGISGLRVTGFAISSTDRSRGYVWESRPSERLPQAPLVVTAVVVGGLFN